jgi:hypothetical protein
MASDDLAGGQDRARSVRRLAGVWLDLAMRWVGGQSREGWHALRICMTTQGERRRRQWSKGGRAWATYMEEGFGPGANAWHATVIDDSVDRQGRRH